jgi:hypothetical protein
MADGVRRQGIVVDHDGRPVGRALVAVTRGTAAVPEIGIRADEHGIFHIWLPLGSFTVEGHSPDGASGSIEVSDTSAESLTLQLRPPSDRK